MNAKKHKAKVPVEENTQTYPAYPVWGEEPEDYEPCMLTDSDPVPVGITTETGSVEQRDTQSP